MIQGRHVALEKNYHFEYDIGQWTFGTVQAVREKATGLKRICKTIPKIGFLDLEKVREEIRRLHQVPRHPHVTCLLEVLEDQSNLHLVYEHCEGEDASEFLGSVNEGSWLDEQTVAVYIRQSLVALAHIHGAGIAHGDLRTSNLGLTTRLPDADIKLTDCGLSMIFDPQRTLLVQNPASAAFIAPEVLDGHADQKPRVADCWSLGAVTYTLLVNRHPFDSSAKQGSLLDLATGQSRSGKPKFRDSDGWSERSDMSKDFLNRLLCPTWERMTAAQALQHPWIRHYAPLGTQRWLRNPEGLVEAESALSKRLGGYSMAVLLLPVLLPPQEFDRQRTAFVAMDGDSDGFVPRCLVGSGLCSQGSKKETVAEALELADATRNGVLDLCSFMVACLLTTNLPPGASPPLAKLEVLFAEAFSDPRQPSRNSVSPAAIHNRLGTNNMVRQLERYTAVRYEAILSLIPEDQKVIDVADVSVALAQGAAHGTPLEVPPAETALAHASEGCTPGTDHLSGVLGLLGLPNFKALHLFNRCATIKRPVSPSIHVYR